MQRISWWKYPRNAAAMQPLSRIPLTRRADTSYFGGVRLPAEAFAGDSKNRIFHAARCELEVGTPRCGVPVGAARRPYQEQGHCKIGADFVKNELAIVNGHGHIPIPYLYAED
jgi:hypothetical protein